MPTEICIQFGKRVRALRRKRGWRQIDLAAHAELGKTHICDIELAKREVCLNTLAKLAAALDVAPADMLPAKPKP